MSQSLGREALKLEEAKEKWLFGFLSVWVWEGVVTPGDALQGACGPQCRALLEQPGLTQREGAFPRAPGHSQHGHRFPDPARPAVNQNPNSTRPPVIHMHVHI